MLVFSFSSGYNANASCTQMDSIKKRRLHPHPRPQAGGKALIKNTVGGAAPPSPLSDKTADTA